MHGSIFGINQNPSLSLWNQFQFCCALGLIFDCCLNASIVPAMSVPAVLPFKTAVHIQSTGTLFLLQVPFSSPCVVIYSGKYLRSLPCLTESLVIKAAGQVKISSIVSCYRKELQSVFLGERDPQKCTFQSFLVPLVWALRVSSMRAIICVFVCLNLFFSVFSGGFGKRTRRRATPSSSPKRR